MSYFSLLVSRRCYGEACRLRKQSFFSIYRLSLIASRLPAASECSLFHIVLQSPMAWTIISRFCIENSYSRRKTYTFEVRTFQIGSDLPSPHSSCHRSKRYHTTSSLKCRSENYYLELAGPNDVCFVDQYSLYTTSSPSAMHASIPGNSLRELARHMSILIFTRHENVVEITGCVPRQYHFCDGRQGQSIAFRYFDLNQIREGITKGRVSVGGSFEQRSL